MVEINIVNFIVGLLVVSDDVVSLTTGGGGGGGVRARLWIRNVAQTWIHKHACSHNNRMQSCLLLFATHYIVGAPKLRGNDNAEIRIMRVNVLYMYVLFMHLYRRVIDAADQVHALETDLPQGLGNLARVRREVVLKSDEAMTNEHKSTSSF